MDLTRRTGLRGGNKRNNTLRTSFQEVVGRIQGKAKDRKVTAGKMYQGGKERDKEIRSG